ncbi:MAG: NUDIX hydrolase [Rhodospirillaceae bacterium]|nr:NUDIX hydrolase [Rhodospirillaceae bacterium]
MSREYPKRPIAGVGVVVLRGDQVLMIRRGREPRIGQWSIPGGKQELGETWQETAVREIREETGVEIDVIGIVDVVDAIVRDGDPPRPGTAEDGTEGVGMAAANDDGDATVVPLHDTPRVRYHYTLVDCAAIWTGGEPVAGGDAAHAEWWPLDRIDELSLWSETVRIITEAAALAAAGRRGPR